MSDGDRVSVDPSGAGQRLDRYLTALGRWGTRSQVQRRIAAGCVQVEGHCAKAGLIVRTGQTIEVRGGVPTAAAGVEPAAIPLAVLYEDEHLLVINKPAGMVVHPAPGNWQGTLVSALLHHWQGLPAGLDPARPGIVHRLDKDTSGVLLIAKNPAALADLSAQFRKREVEKQYVAFVWGRLREATGTITEPIGRNPVHRLRMAVRRGGREAQTRFQVLERHATMTLVRLWPRTGRTHQLRVHLAAMGHPIVGDVVYGGARARRGRPLIARQALHAETITFRHPCTHALLRFTAPLPADLTALQDAAKSSCLPAGVLEPPQP